MAEQEVGPGPLATAATGSHLQLWFWRGVLLVTSLLLVAYPLLLLASLVVGADASFLSALAHAGLITGLSVPSNLRYVLFAKVRESEDLFTVALTLTSVPVAFVSVWNVLALFGDLGMEPIRIFGGDYAVHPTQLVWLYLILGTVAYGIAVTVGWTYKGHTIPNAEPPYGL
jgi:hypothetical protein